MPTWPDIKDCVGYRQLYRGGSEYECMVQRYTEQFPTVLQDRFYDRWDSLKSGHKINRNLLLEWKHQVDGIFEEWSSGPTLEEFESFVEWARESIKSISEGVESNTKASVDAALDEVESSSSKMVESFDTQIANTSELITTASENQIGIFDRAMQVISDTYNNTVDYLGGVFEGTIKELDDVYNLLNSEVEDVYGLLTRQIEDFFDKTREKQFEQIEDAAANSESLFERVYTSIDGVLDEAEEFITPALKTFEQSADDVVNAIGEQAKLAKESILPSLDSIISSLGELIGFFDPSILGEGIDDGKKFVDSVFARLLDPEDNLLTTMRELSESTVSGTMGSRILYSIVVGVATAVFLPQALLSMTAPKLVNMSHNINTLYPNQEFSPAEAATLYARRIIDENEAVLASRRGGLADEKFNSVHEGAKTNLDIERATQALNRGFITEERFTEILERLGVRDSDIDVIQRLRYVLPPIQDQILFSVREVYNQALADQFQLFAEFPAEFAKQAAKQGLTEEWAKRYWAAHWRLPSAQMGYEMFHRDVASEEMLDSLLRGLDYSPAWREALKQIAYSTITRVDIRRIYKLGFIDREEVAKRYRHLGYNPVDAELLADFTAYSYAPEEEDDDVDPRQLTMTQIKRLWGVGTINSDIAKDRLVEAGYAVNAASLLVDSWGNEADIEYRAGLIERYVRKAIREDLQGSEVDKLFSDLDLTTEELTRVKQVIEIERNEYDHLPTVAQIRQMRENNIISYELWFSTMRQHGYAKHWIDAYAKLWDIKQ